MVSVYQSSTIEESVIRGGVKIQKRDSETGEAKPQGSATLEGTVFAPYIGGRFPVRLMDRQFLMPLNIGVILNSVFNMSYLDL